MELAEKAVGFLLSVPFVDDHLIHKYFLLQEFAILIPVLAGVALLFCLSVFVGFVMLKSKKKTAYDISF
ncbi:Dolichol-phosphate mannose synthase subunit 2 [Camellia lanceoleosa]|uniref:Dolichol-phosphate mannose synthase subunit 2 n=1 Tax=Camellia lanceoleosa TaxID=1840588 RepID=A0ACC0IW76_9ERIC|nr:Dolichol-phosphate mannose synthase subunit 2 [Camellia lanceoleosa]